MNGAGSNARTILTIIRHERIAIYVSERVPETWKNRQQMISEKSYIFAV